MEFCFYLFKLNYFKIWKSFFISSVENNITSSLGPPTFGLSFYNARWHLLNPSRIIIPFGLINSAIFLSYSALMCGGKWVYMVPYSHRNTLRAQVWKNLQLHSWISTCSIFARSKALFLPSILMSKAKTFKPFFAA